MADLPAYTDWFTVHEVAAHLRVSGMTVYRLVKTAVLPHTKVGKSFRIHRDDLTAYLATQHVAAAPLAEAAPEAAERDAE